MQQNNQLAQFDKLKADITMLVAPAKEIVVSSKETQTSAMTSVKEVVSWKKKVEEKRQELVAPLLEMQRDINAYAKKITEPLIAVESHLKTELIVWDKKLEAERQVELKRIEEYRKKKENEPVFRAQQETYQYYIDKNTPKTNT
jgi:hypothetical protein